MKRLILVLLLLVFAGCTPRYVAQNGVDTGNCSNSNSPCATLEYAYGQAASGDAIAVKGGTKYPHQKLPDGTKTITVAPQPSTGVVTLDSLRIEASNSTLDAINVDQGGSVELGLSIGHENSAVLPENVTYKNAAVGNVTDEKGALVAGTNITMDGVFFHHVYVTDPAVHNECLYAIVVPGFTIKNPTFYHCATQDILFTWLDWGGAYGNVTVDDNDFGEAWGTSGPQGNNIVVGGTGPTPTTYCDGDPLPPDNVTGAITNWTVTDNYFSQDNPYLLDSSCPGRPRTNFVYSGNTGPGA